MDIKFLKWKVDKLQEDIEKAKQHNYYSERHIGYLEGIKRVWEDFLFFYCEHKWECYESDYGIRYVCKKCECESIDTYFDLETHRHCNNCRYFDTEGGDSVSYGNTYATLPEVPVCLYLEDSDGINLDEITDEEYKKIEKLMDKYMENSKECPWWEGK